MSSYLGNPSLKDANVKIQWTAQRIEEFNKCADDPNYFITKYVKVITLDEGVSAFKLWPFQENLIETVHANRFVICKMPRQSGKSTTLVAYFLHYILFNKHKAIGILANKRDQAVELLSRLQLAFELLPYWLQQGVKVWNKTSIQLENGCRIEAHATSGQSVRGKTFQIIMLDEFAHIEPKLAEKFWTSTFPVISSGTKSKVLIVSTPNGMNLFYELWDKAVLGSENPRWNRFHPVEVHYSEVPGREKPEWAEEQIAIMGQEKFDQEFGCEFLGSGSTLISGRFLKTMISLSPIHSQNGLDVHEDPKMDIDKDTGIKSQHVYVMAVDTARGKQLDYSAFSVIDVTDSPYKVVAKYRSNNIPVPAFADVIVPVARRYNNAYVLIEVDGPGHQIADDLHHLHEYENIMTVVTKGRSGQMLATGFGNQGKNLQRGLKMSPPVRRTGCANLKTLVESKRLTIMDFEIKTELSTFSLKGDRYEAEEGKHDDLVMTLVTFSWLSTQKHFRDLMEAKVRQSLVAEYQPQMQHDATPFGWIEDGIDKKEVVITSGDIWTQVGGGAWDKFFDDQQRYATRYFDKEAAARLDKYFGA